MSLNVVEKGANIHCIVYRQTDRILEGEKASIFVVSVASFSPPARGESALLGGGILYGADDSRADVVAVVVKHTIGASTARRCCLDGVIDNRSWLRLKNKVSNE